MTGTNTKESFIEKKQVYFSIIIPMYNREATIRRCLDSALSQDFKNYEVIVVDDASEDGSSAVVESYLPNPQIILVKSPENHGVCAARGLGVSHSSGKWIMFIDSDDTFHPGAFQVIHDEVSSAPEEVNEVRFCYWSQEYNLVTPVPFMPEGIIGFPEYLHWLDEVENSDLFYCHRREIYDEISWPQDRSMPNHFFLKLASKFKIKMLRQVIGTMHNDAGNRMTNAQRGQGPSYPRMLKGNYDDAVALSGELLEFKDELKKYCPKRYKLWKRTTGYLYFKAGCRVKGCRYMLSYLVKNPLDATAWVRLFLGLMGPRAIQKRGKTFRDIGKKMGFEIK